jgi:hypothetical protein
MQNRERVGGVIHYYVQIGVAVLKLSQTISAGERLHFLGAHTDFHQQVQSMQIDNEPVEQALNGSEVAIKVDQRVRRGDSVFRLPDQTLDS